MSKKHGIKTFGDGMGGNKGHGRQWSFGDESGGEEVGGLKKLNISSTPLFSPSLLPVSILSTIPDGYTLRPLERDDYSKGFFETLQVLTSTGDVSKEAFEERFNWMRTKGEGVHYFVVIEHQGKVVGTGTVVLERKFIHNLGTIGHIEEIAISKDQQGKKLGIALIQALSGLAKSLGCYKTTLGTGTQNEAFYEKCGYEKRGTVMSQYFEKASTDFERG